MSKKIVLDVGNCNADHSFIKFMLESKFDATVLRAHKLDDAATALKENEIDLIMINRLLDVDGSEGMDVFRQLNRDGEAKIPTMLITNYEDHQQAAIREGAVRGFGKSALNSEETLAVIGDALGVSV